MSRFGEILSNSNWPKGNKLDAAVAPSATDDSNAGYEVGSLWVDTTANKAYVCVDDSVGAAIWTETTVTGGGVTELNDLTDVATGLPGSPTNADYGRVLYFDNAVDDWISDDIANTSNVVKHCKTASGTIAKGVPVYLVDFDGDLLVVAAADAASAATMPCIGITAEIIDATTTPNNVVSFGKIQNIDTTGLLTKEALWVASGGGLTTTRPTGTALVQQIAVVLKENTTSGSIKVFNTSRIANLPNLPNGQIWQGDVNGHPQPVDPATAAKDWVPPMTDVSSGATGQSAALLTIPAWNDPPGPDPAVGGIGTFRNFAAADDEAWAFQVPLYNNIAYDGRNITIDIHWMIFDAADPGALEDVVWEVDYYFGRDGVDVYDAVTAGIYVSDPPPGISTTVNLNGRIGSPGSGQVQYTDTIASAISGPVGSTTLHVVIKRQGATDTYTGAGEIYGITFR